ncbi:hypothetical protein ATK36_5418 [Amycolatopsis sulphurea]|uniref:Helix-turn-helix domain-containing protein n=1 Tax=Amycolatopsis sulphurea TaxID=76022 RepID=A0A2A9FIF6_9PSEU|nr:hypothetical protein [Amycolatopsis sulphurea]PFG50209.1 hypothetical protein ATK36_5418 [Amycolatopsis sulphurea]
MGARSADAGGCSVGDDDAPAGKAVARQARNAAMLQAYLGGESLTEIADQAGVSLSWAGRLLRDAGVVMPERRQGVKRHNLDVPAIIREYRDGQSTRALGDRHDTSYQTIRRLLLRSGVQLRPHGKPPRQ